MIPYIEDRIARLRDISHLTCALAVLTMMLAGCGGGSSAPASPPPPPPPPTTTVSISSTSISEGDAGDVVMNFTVSLSATSTSTVTVNYTTVDGSAIAPADYDTASGLLSFASGTTTQNVPVTVHGDATPEGDQSFTIRLSAPGNATLGTSTATGTIIDDDGAVVSGLDARPDNQTCLAPARPTVDTGVSVVDPFLNLPDINLPTKMILEPVANPRWFVLQKSGEVVTFDPDNATSLSTFLDVSGVVRTDIEGGLLGLAFHPNYPATPEVFLSYTEEHTGPDMRSVISRFILDDVANPGAGTEEQVILLVNQDGDSHNGGDIAFGADGYLYLGLGDGGGAGDTRNRAQDTTYLFGSMLRIDVTGPGVSFPTNPYNIPPDNPFAGNAECGPAANANACPEIYAWGFRNPWRWSFDPPTGALWLGDVGQGTWEEVDVVELGGKLWLALQGRRT